MKRRQKSKGEHEAAQTDKRNRKSADLDYGAGIGSGHCSLVRRPKTNGQSVKNQGQAKADQQRILDADLFMRFDDELKQRPVEDQPKHEQRRSNAQQRKERIDLPKREEPECSVTAQHKELSMGDVQDPKDPE